MSRLLLTFICLTLLSSGCGAAAPAAEVHRSVVDPQKIPTYIPRYDRTRPVVAVIGENEFTELTDYVVPYSVLAESGVAEVVAIATRAGPIQMFPALKLQPQATSEDFDKRHPAGADYVIVPAVHRADDPLLLKWINAQATKGATIVGVCDGVRVLANAGLLAGRTATGHWYSFDDLQRRFPGTRWVRNLRYVVDGPIVTTTGVTASIPVSLALVEAIAGHGKAREVAAALGVPSWSPTHDSNAFRLTAAHLFTAAACVFR
jgi:transcriptional regulator GlxA family with amidase domain